MNDIERANIFLKEFQKIAIANGYSVVMLLEQGGQQNISSVGKQTKLTTDAYSMLEALCENYTCSVCGKKHNVNVEH